jgi:ribosomal protein L7/L12
LLRKHAVRRSGLPNIDELQQERDVHGLIDALRHEDKDVRTSAAIALREIAREKKAGWRLVLTGVGANRITVMKLVRELAALSLQEAKQFLDALPATVLEGVSRTNAEAAASKLERAGATIEIEDVDLELIMEPLFLDLRGMDSLRREWAAEALGEWADARAVESLTKALKSADEWEKLARDAVDRTFSTDEWGSSYYNQRMDETAVPFKHERKTIIEALEKLR